MIIRPKLYLFVLLTSCSFFASFLIVTFAAENNIATEATPALVAPIAIQDTTLSTKHSSQIATTIKTSFADNDQLKIILSNRDINRIAVTGDKVQAINGPTGLYTAKNDSWGSAYLSVYGEKPFTIFLTTIQGHNCSLLITPQVIPGRTVVLEPTTPVLFTSSSVATDNYQKTLLDLMNNMINFEPSEDYEYFSVREAQKQRWLKKIKRTNFYNLADITPVVFYRGEKLSGLISRVSNRMRNNLILQPSYFYQPGVKAAALSHQTIPPLSSCWLYQIVSQD